MMRGPEARNLLAVGPLLSCGAPGATSLQTCEIARLVAEVQEPNVQADFANLGVNQGDTCGYTNQQRQNGLVQAVEADPPPGDGLAAVGCGSDFTFAFPGASV